VAPEQGARGGQGSAQAAAAAVSQLFISTRFSIFQLLYDIFIGKQRSRALLSRIYTN